MTGDDDILPVIGLADFLLARITEDEAAARAFESGRSGDAGGIWGRDTDGPGDVAVVAAFEGVGGPADPARVLAECAAKRRRVEITIDARDELDLWQGEALLRLEALPYAGHPDYRPEWAPDAP